MPTASWRSGRISAALILISMATGSGALARQASVFLTLPSGGTLRFTTRGDRTAIKRKTREVLLDRDAAVASQAPVLSVKLIAEAPGSVLILTDSYPSRAGGLSYCQAGEEEFLRVIAGMKETFRVKLRSCIGELELGEHGISWDAATSALRVEWIGTSASYHVDEIGQVTASME